VCVVVFLFLRTRHAHKYTGVKSIIIIIILIIGTITLIINNNNNNKSNDNNFTINDHNNHNKDTIIIILILLNTIQNTNLKQMDGKDPLRSFRDKFHMPTVAPHEPNGNEALYLWFVCAL